MTFLSVAKKATIWILLVSKNPRFSPGYLKQTHLLKP